MSTDVPRIKICGVTTRDDALFAVEAGAWAVGCILWPGSPRACDPAEAARIATALRRRAQVCGVFVNAPLDEVAGMVDGIGLTMVQLHGDEGPAFCSEVARRTGAKVIKAAAVSGKADIRALEAFHTDYHLLDAHQRRDARRHGGDLRLGARALAALADPARAERRAAPGERRRGDRRRAAVRRRHGQRDRGAPRGQGPREGRGLRRGGQLPRAPRSQA